MTLNTHIPEGHNTCGKEHKNVKQSAPMLPHHCGTKSIVNVSNSMTSVPDECSKRYADNSRTCRSDARRNHAKSEKACWCGTNLRAARDRGLDSWLFLPSFAKRQTSDDGAAKATALVHLAALSAAARAWSPNLSRLAPPTPFASFATPLYNRPPEPDAPPDPEIIECRPEKLCALFGLPNLVGVALSVMPDVCAVGGIKLADAGQQRLLARPLCCRPANIEWRESWSKAPTASMDNTVARKGRRTSASVPARGLRPY